MIVAGYANRDFPSSMAVKCLLTHTMRIHDRIPHGTSARLRALYGPLGLLALLTATVPLSGQQVQVVDWVSVNVGPVLNTAIGTLGGTTVRLEGIGVGDVGLLPSYSVLDGSSTVFNTADFEPRLPKSDALSIGIDPTPRSYTVVFSRPVKDPVLLVQSLASVLVPRVSSITKLGGDGRFVVTNAVVFGSYYPDADDPNGTVRLNGIFTTFTFSLFWPYGSDGIMLQIGAIEAVTEPLIVTATAAVRVGFQTELRKKYQVQSSPRLPSAAWESVGTVIEGTGQPLELFLDAADGQARFFRVLIGD